MNYAIGVDIGGTKTAIAMVDNHGKIVCQDIILTNLEIPPKEMIAEIVQVIKNLIDDASIEPQQIAGIGIGSPGPLDSENGVIVCPPNLPDWTNIPMKQMVETALPYPVRLENDANAAALAERWLGAAQGCSEVVYMTVSTGIGAGIITGGKILHGKNGNAGDIGHTVVDPSFGPCTCGQDGCLEAIASGTAIAKHGSEVMGRRLDTEEVFNLYVQQEPKIVSLIDQVFKTLGIACVSLINTFDAEMIVIGGGVSKVGDPLFKAIREYTSKYALNPKGREAKVVPAMLEQNSGVIGAAGLWLHATKIDEEPSIC